MKFSRLARIFELGMNVLELVTGLPQYGAMTDDEFMDWVSGQPGRYEFVHGFPLELMAGAKQDHAVAASNIITALSPIAKRHGCRTTGSDTYVKAGGNRRLPDIVVDCGPKDSSITHATKPTVVVEVLSDITSAIDHTDKLDDYQSHPDIGVVLLVDPMSVSVKVYRRQADAKWAPEKYEDLAEIIPLPEIEASLAMADIYDTLEPKPRFRTLPPRGSTGPQI